MVTFQESARWPSTRVVRVSLHVAQVVERYLTKILVKEGVCNDAYTSGLADLYEIPIRCTS